MRPAPLREPVLALFFAGSAVVVALILVAIGMTYLPAISLLPTVSFGDRLQGTLAIAAVAMAVAIPLGLITAIYLNELASPLERRVFRPLLSALAGVPGVAFGWGALMVLGMDLPARWSTGQPWFVAGLVLGSMLIPVVSSLAQNALSAVPRSLREAGWALGASELAVVARVVLPAAKTGLGAALLLATARAIGETMIVWIAAGPINLGAQMGQLRLEGAFESALAMGAVLLVFTGSLNVLAHRWVRRQGSWT